MINESSFGMPYSHEAEVSVLGSCLINKDALAEVAGTLLPEDFYEERHKILFQVMTQMYEEGIPVDLVTFVERLKRDNLLDVVGGQEYVAQVASSVYTAANVGTYAKLVKERSLQRSLIRVGTEIARLGYTGKNIEEDLDKAQQLVFSLSMWKYMKSATPVSELVKRYYSLIEERYAQRSRVTGYPTGLQKLDELLTGFQKSDLLILAARPGMGKTAFALNVATYMSMEEEIPVLFFSLEMSATQLVQRLLSAVSNVPSQKLKTGYLATEDFDALRIAMSRLEDAPLWIDESPGLSVLEIRSRARRAVAELGIKMIIIDYLQLIRLGQNVDNRVQEVSEITRSLKNLARELDIPLLVLSQLSRAVEQRADKRPQLSDLRESGSIEQDADVVMFLYSEDYYKQQKGLRPENSAVELVVAKHRNGPTGEVKLMFRKDIGRFYSLEENVWGDEGAAVSEE
ncbi:replicative DNA helicase [Coprothermobacter proteolyticus]|uniref:replicative DNA helicase n=1 Tax=Coprothermobacter proteolyticus TaxID=35786 RepID=UPI000D326849|nr:replicative DNA helicase [Coprothermobacter proteolyticus]MBK6585743.1 replicative DNA helicase [Coprothermobacter sp.]NLT83484.1 replicative DNA helicase [Coprothermobacter proteolyticus]HOK24664.1 replicative DNA helicase [Coprothermobacter proteolyticus]HOL53419.1 replicative DNA helicase [Coprothermobacter proteolyticus]